jgi:outer membrane protein assembly factor BamA
MLDLRSYNKLSPANFLDFSLKLGYSNQSLPRQRIFYLGGVSTLRGYEYKEFGGNAMILGNLEYRIGVKTPQVVLLVDAGTTWDTNIKSTPDFSDIKPSIGVGVQDYDGNFRISVHKALDRKEAPFKIYFRVNTTF